jgi:alpha-mannosidase
VSKSLFTASLLMLISPELLQAQVTPKRIYIAADEHTDYYWTATGDSYRQAFLDMIDYYLDQADATTGDPSDQQSRWNCDGSLWMWEYEKNKSAADFQRFISQIKSGHMSVPLTALVSCEGGAPAEAVLRGMYYPGRIERGYDLRFQLAVAMENQTLPYGLGALWAGAGAKYTWKGICDCATQVRNPGDREHEIYWWNGPDGSRLLAKWYTLVSNKSIGGYAEARNPTNAINLVDSNTEFLNRYPYNIIGVFGQGWDDFKTTDQDMVNAAVSQTNSNRRIIVSNELDFFQDFETTYGSGLPSLSCSFGNEWDLYCASMAEVSARVKRSVEKLRSAEAVATLVSLRSPSFMTGRETARDQAFMNLGVYWEHDWTADGPVGRQTRADWQRGLAEEIEDYVDTLYNDAVMALGGLIQKSGDNTRFCVFNPLSWVRTDFADYPFTNAVTVHVVDLSTNLEVPSQRVSVDSEHRLRILAPDIPPAGYKVFEIRSGAGTTLPNAASVNGGVIENDRYKVTVAERGAITSLLDKTRTNREFVLNTNGKYINDLGTGSGNLQVENAGPVSVTLLATSSSPLEHTSRITLFREINRIEIRNDINENFSDIHTWSHSFNLSNPDVRHEEVGAVIRARLLADGGHYSGRNARYDWLTLNHFADMSSSNVGITLSNADCYFFRLGNSTNTSLDTTTPVISVLAGGQVDGTSLGIQNQDGDTHFLQRFALTTHGSYSALDAMQFSLEHQNPLIAQTVSDGVAYPPTIFSFLSISNPNTVLWALKPAEEGIHRGVIARLWNLSGSQSSFALNLTGKGISSAKETTHIETETGDATLSSGVLSETLAGNQIKTYLLTPFESVSGISTWMVY